MNAGRRPRTALRPIQRRGFVRLAVVALGLSPVLAFLGSCDGESDAYTVTMTPDMAFDPESLTVPSGATVTWSNASDLPHTSTSDPALAVDRAHALVPPGAMTWDSGLIKSGGRWSHRLDVPGAYTYFCLPHETAGMVGHITVTV
jgi:plastocyanin